MLITRLLMVLEVWDGKPTYRKSWAGILLVWSDLTLGPLLLGQMRTAKLKSAYNSLIMSTPLRGGHIIFAFSGVRRPTWFPDILGNSSYPIFTKFGMQVYWVNSLYGIAFGDDSSIAN